MAVHLLHGSGGSDDEFVMLVSRGDDSRLCELPPRVHAR